MGNTQSRTKWSIDPVHSEIAFKVKHMMLTNVNGAFKTFTATAESEGEDFIANTIHLDIDAASINTGVDDRDGHLKSADFFDVEVHKALTFVGTSIKKVDVDNFQLTGNLTIKGVTKEVKLDVEYGGVNKDPWGNEKAGFSITGKINRKDFGLVWNAALETGGVLVGEDIKLSAEVQFVKQA